MTHHLKPILHLVINGQPARSIASLGGPNAITLIALVGDDQYHVVHQRPDGRLLHRFGPLTMEAAVDAAERVLAGRERSVTGDGVAAVAGLTVKLAATAAERDALRARLEQELTPHADTPA